MAEGVVPRTIDVKGVVFGRMGMEAWDMNLGDAAKVELVVKAHILYSATDMMPVKMGHRLSVVAAPGKPEESDSCKPSQAKGQRSSRVELYDMVVSLLVLVALEQPAAEVQLEAVSEVVALSAQLEGH